MNRLQRETLANHPAPPTTPLEALAHVLAIYEDSPDDMVILTATRSIYPEAPFTGLRLGDLRRLLDAHAHELAERIRADASSVIPVHTAWRRGMARAADFIDPEVSE